MTYQEHQTAGKTLDKGKIRENLGSLGRDPRFAGVVAWLENNRDSFILHGSRQDLASDHGKLAHGQGSVHAINVLIAQLMDALDRSRKADGGIPEEPGQ